jgi:hypothetical protein
MDEGFRYCGSPGVQMTAEVDHGLEMCKKLMSLGFARLQRVRLYGQEVQLVSDPFPDREGKIAVEVKGRSESVSRTIRLPLPVVQVARKNLDKRTA